MDGGIYAREGGRVSDREALERLGRSHGIAPDYYDIWGQRHEVPDASLRALLGALGVHAATPQEAEESIRAGEFERWRAMLAPVVVVRDDAAPWSLRLNLPAADANSPLAWRLTQEDGMGQEVPIDAASLNAAESAELDGERFTACEFALPVTAPCGYHRLAILRDGAVLGETTLVVVPELCFRPLAVQHDGRVWGAAVQLYAVRSERNWGIGDFTDLAALLAQWGTRGAGVVGVNPLHALFPHNPEHASPYSPSSRCFLDVLYLDVEVIADFAECDEALAQARAPSGRRETPARAACRRRDGGRKNARNSVQASAA